MNEPKFLKNIRQNRLRRRNYVANVKPEFTIERVTRPLSQVSQILLVAVVLFGYFYTVQPIYQKERLAEQVAQYEIEIGEQLARIEQAQSELIDLRALATFEHEKSQRAAQVLNETVNELDALVTEREKLLYTLNFAEKEKERIESQIKFMQFKHFLPDGTPADSDEEVEIAIRERNRSAQRRSYFSGLRTRAQFIEYSDESNFVFGLKGDKDTTSGFYPFAEEELTAWKMHGLGYPRHVARNLIETTTTRQSLVRVAGASGDVDSADLEIWRAIAREQLEKNEDRWTAPQDPVLLADAYRKTRAEYDENLAFELEKVEQEFGDWAEIRNAKKRAIYENYYKISIEAARSWAVVYFTNLEHNYGNYADRFRKSAADEIERLLVIEDTARDQLP